MLIYRHLAIMVYSEKLLKIKALMKCEDHHTKKANIGFALNCLYQNKGNNPSVKGLILTKLIGYLESIVLIICTKNESNLTKWYWDIVLDGQKVWTDRQNGRTDDAKTISLRLRRGIKRFSQMMRIITAHNILKVFFYIRLCWHSILKKSVSKSLKFGPNGNFSILSLFCQPFLLP